MRAGYRHQADGFNQVNGQPEQLFQYLGQELHRQFLAFCFLQTPQQPPEPTLPDIRHKMCSEHR